MVISAACPGPSFCLIGNDHGGILSSVNPAGGVGAWTETQSGTSELIRGISCPSEAFCVAVDGEGNALIGRPGQEEEGGNEQPPQPELPVNPPTAAPTAAAPSSPSQPIVTPALVKPKPLRCRKGFRKQKVNGKPKCVKVKPRRHRR